MPPSGLASFFPSYRNFSKGASKCCVRIFFTRLLHRPWPLLDIQGPNISFGTTHQVVNWRLQRFNVEMFEICMFHSTVISVHMLIQTRMILVQNSNVPGVTCVIIVGKCCWTKSSRNLFNNIYTWNVVEQNRLNKESIAPFQRSDVRVFADVFWSLRLVPLDFQHSEICWKTTPGIAWFFPYSSYYCFKMHRFEAWFQIYVGPRLPTLFWWGPWGRTDLNLSEPYKI